MLKCININLYILLYLLRDKAKYNIYRKYIVINKEERLLSLFFSLLDSIYESHPERDGFLLEEFSVYVRSKAPGEETDEILSQLLESKVGDDVLHDLVEEARKRAFALEIALISVDVSDGKKPFDSLLTKWAEFGTIDGVEDEIAFVTDDLNELYEHNVKQQGLRWRLNTLNSMLGSLRKGDFGFIFARPETGKTTFLASEISFMASQAQGPIVWFNNEEQGEKVKLRLYQATLGLTLDQLFADRAKNIELYKQLGGENIKLVDNANLYKHDVEKICKQLKPSLVVFDQIDKIKGFSSDREDLRLGSIYQWAREIAKEFAPVIAVCQADGSGEGKKWLTMENVANAKTSKQAEADWILGLGKTNELGMEYVRHLHLSKNKLTGDEDSIPELRHGRRDVIIRPEYARYEDIQ